jgi:hypothetical protein
MTRTIQFRPGFCKKLGTNRNANALKPRSDGGRLGHFSTTSTWKVPGIREGRNSPAFFGANSPVGK